MSCSRAGLRLAKDGKACEDVDECAEHTDECDQQCINKDPRKSGIPYACSCNLGYSLDLQDRHNCIKTVRYWLQCLKRNAVLLQSV